jgi:hypothetical protein
MSTCPYVPMSVALSMDTAMDIWTYGRVDMWTCGHVDIKAHMNIIEKDNSSSYSWRIFSHYMFCLFYTFCHYTFCPFITFVVILFVPLYLLLLYVLSFIPFVVLRFVFLYLLSLYVFRYTFCRYTFHHRTTPPVR